MRVSLEGGSSDSLSLSGSKRGSGKDMEAFRGGTGMDFRRIDACFSLLLLSVLCCLCSKAEYEIKVVLIFFKNWNIYEFVQKTNEC